MSSESSLIWFSRYFLNMIIIWGGYLFFLENSYPFIKEIFEDFLIKIFNVSLHCNSVHPVMSSKSYLIWFSGYFPNMIIIRGGYLFFLENSYPFIKEIFEDFLIKIFNVPLHCNSVHPVMSSESHLICFSGYFLNMIIIRGGYLFFLENSYPFRDNCCPLFEVGGLF